MDFLQGCHKGAHHLMQRQACHPMYLCICDGHSGLEAPEQQCACIEQVKQVCFTLGWGFWGSNASERGDTLFGASSSLDCTPAAFLVFSLTLPGILLGFRSGKIYEKLSFSIKLWTPIPFLVLWDPLRFYSIVTNFSMKIILTSYSS